MAQASFTIAEIEAARERIAEYIHETPVRTWQTPAVDGLIGKDTDVVLKLELFQKTGTFKPRGALTVMLNLAQEELDNGVTAVSGGNHAVAVAYAASILGVSAKVVIPKAANPFRVQACESYGAEIVFADDIHHAFDLVDQIKTEENRTAIHPFEGPYTALGTATVGLEFARQAPDLDAVIVPIGGGGLCAGVSAAFKMIQPDCKVYGVEPEGANTMYLSFQSGQPESIEKVQTIADSLGSPRSEPYSFGLCQHNVDDIVLVSDDDLRTAMKLLFEDAKLVTEPASASATAALCGPLKEKLQGKRVGIVVCGSNIDFDTFSKIIA